MAPVPFRHGDLVRHRSSGRMMEVVETAVSIVVGKQSVWCMWLEDGEKRRDIFRPEDLELVMPEN
jgi:uncharacterized protein YodC (DUF2158 family)